MPGSKIPAPHNSNKVVNGRDERDYKNQGLKPSNNRPYSAKRVQDINQIYNPNQIYNGGANRDRNGGIQRNNSKNRLYGAGAGAIAGNGIINAYNPNINYLRDKRQNRPPSGAGANNLFGFKRAPAKNVVIGKLDYQKYMQNKRNNDNQIHGNRDNLYQAMGFPSGYQGPRIINHKK